MCLSRPPATHDEQNLDRSARTSAGPTPTSPASACATTASKAAATARSSLLSRHIVRMEKRLAEESACEHRDRPRSPEIARDRPRSPEIARDRRDATLVLACRTPYACSAEAAPAPAVAERAASMAEKISGAMPRPRSDLLEAGVCERRPSFVVRCRRSDSHPRYLFSCGVSRPSARLASRLYLGCISPDGGGGQAPHVLLPLGRVAAQASPGNLGAEAGGAVRGSRPGEEEVSRKYLGSV